MLIKRKYVIRHKILAELQKKLSLFDGKEQLNVEHLEIKLQDLSRTIGLSEKEILSQVDYLGELQEINCNWEKGNLNFIILKKGTISYFDKKYLCEGREEFWKNSYDVIKTVSAVLILVIAVTTFTMNLIDTRTNKHDIESLKSSIQQIRDSVVTVKAKK